MTKGILQNNNIPFEYILMDDMTKEEKTKVLAKARKIGALAMPIILVDDEVKSKLQEVLQCK